MKQSLFRLVGPAGIGGVGFALSLVVGIRSWRQSWQARLTSAQREWNKNSAALQVCVTEARQAASVAEEARGEAVAESARLLFVTQKLQAELDQLKRAERTLTRRRQELESSKTVLELHVAERTDELQKLQRRYELILNSAGEGICGLDLRGKAAFANPVFARITGCEAADLLGKTENEIFGAESVAGSPEKHSGERMFRRGDGRVVPIEYVRTTLEDDGKSLGTVLVIKDITERKRAEEAMTQRAAELARSNAELEQFAFVASHDLQEPLRKIQAFGDRLKTKVEGAVAEEARDYLDRMQGASARMRTLINDLLAFSRVIRRTEPFVSVDLDAVLKGVLGDLEVRIEKSGAKVESGPLPTIEADSMQMHQLILNLLGNALKFQPPGAQPHISINSRLFKDPAGDDFCELSFQDNGIGFDEKYMDKIFAVFQCLHGRNEYEGTGVGLAVCRRITDRHHGTITAKSQLGKGATFIVTLPVKQPAANANP